MAKLRRTQVYLDSAMLNKVKTRARQAGTTMAEIIRQALEKIMQEEEVLDWSNDPIWRIVGSGKSGHHDTSAKHDQYLYGSTK